MYITPTTGKPFFSSSILLFLLAFLWFSLLSSCSSNPLDVDVSEIDIELDLKRFDKDIFEADTNRMIAEVAGLRTKYPYYFDAYMADLVGIGGSTDDEIARSLFLFSTNKDMRETYDSVSKEYDYIEDIEVGLENAFRHYKYYFPDREVPTVLTSITGFNYQVNPTQEGRYLGIGLEMYLGKDSRFYEMLNWPKYRRFYCSRKMIVTDCMRGLAQKTWEMDRSKNRFLDHLIYNGKLLYFVEAMAPGENDSIIMGYKGDQIQWCLNSEKALWRYIIDQEVVYSTEYSSYIRYFNDAPFTTNVSPDSPPRLGAWIGWQVVKEYMINNPDVSLSELMEKNSDEIFTRSGYKP